RPNDRRCRDVDSFGGNGARRSRRIVSYGFASRRTHLTNPAECFPSHKSHLTYAHSGNRYRARGVGQDPGANGVLLLWSKGWRFRVTPCVPSQVCSLNFLSQAIFPSLMQDQMTGLVMPPTIRGPSLSSGCSKRGVSPPLNILSEANDLSRS